jgi:phosphopantothenoylcysteine decarboxylase / phosphopantothenate---cysteine ligase
MTVGRPRIVVGLTGGIAAYKVVGVIRELVRRGADVTVVPSESSREFIGQATLEAISRNPVHYSLFDDVAQVRHVALGQAADAVLVAPATANTLSALAEGRADSLLLTTVLASSAPMIIAPAMHTEMWEHAATQQNLQTLTDRGAIVVGPGTGALTGEDVGVGRLATEDEIVEAVWSAIQPADLAGMRVLITAGGTREPIDPVRFIGNRSTGHMGVACAIVARDRGAEVTLVGAHLEVPVPVGITTAPVSTAADMRAAVLDRVGQSDVFLSVAAVSDYRVVNFSPHKLKKTDGVPDLKLAQNPDILREVIESDYSGIVVGFAAETDEDRFAEIAADKARSKGADLLVANLVGESRGFGSVATSTLFLNSVGSVLDTIDGSKMAVASRIFDFVSRQKENTP